MGPGLTTGSFTEVSVWIGREVAVRNNSRMTMEASAYRDNFLPPTEPNNPYYLVSHPGHPQIRVSQMELSDPPIYFSSPFIAK